MRKSTLYFCMAWFAFMGLSLSSQAQRSEANYKILLKGQTILLPASSDFSAFAEANGNVVEGRFYRIVQFNETPGATQRAALEAQGLKFQDYVAHHAYVVSFPSGFDVESLRTHNVRALSFIRPDFKLNPVLANGNLPSYAIRAAGTVDLMVAHYSDLNPDAVHAELTRLGYDVLDFVNHAHWTKIRVQDNAVNDIASLPFLVSVEPDQELGEPESDDGRGQHRSNVIDADYSAGRQYDGTGINAVINDDGFVGPHIDFKGRTNQTDVANDFAGTHGDMTTGILGGAGNLDPYNRGMATDAFIHVMAYTSTMNQTVNKHTNDDVVVFSTSYSNGCNAGYTTVTQMIDQEVNTYPTIHQVFSAGNSNGQDCGYGAGSNWGNVTGGHKIAKNVMAVANLYSNETVETSSSHGPASDGRLKPEIASHGQNQMSTAPDNTYALGGGTSAACPGVAGVSVQLYDAYKSMNGGTTPENAIIKMILMNTADEIGNPGPDYIYGFGRINGRKAIRTLEENRFASGTVSNGGTSTQTITIPSGVTQAKIMVYWRDPAASTIAAKALVNDLDMTVTDPGAGTNYPLVLDPTPNPTNLNANAVPGVDTLNNVEQVTFTNPAAGTYTVNIMGTDVPAGPQGYYVTWHFDYDSLFVTYPNGGEGFTPGTTERLRWDANIGGSGNFTLEYSTNNGSSWNTITTSANATRTYYDWGVPSNATGNCWIRVSRNGITGTHEAPFSIISRPANIQFDWVCVDSAQISWNNTSGATGYDVYMLGAKHMDYVGSTTGNSFVITGINPFDPEVWVSVAATGPNNAEGRRANAVNMPPGINNCLISEDITVELLSPAGGQIYSCLASDSVAIKVRLTNTGVNALSSIPLNYSLNAGPTVTETWTGTLASGASTDYSFSNILNMTSNGNYDLDIWASLPTDGNPYNDSVISSTQILSGSTVAYPWSDDFESFFNCATTNNCEATVCNLTSGWLNYSNSSYDDIDFRTDNGGTPSANTGPSMDHNPGTTNGKYVYLEASNGCIFQTATMLSPCIDLAGGIDPMVNFWYHMYGADMGTLRVDVISEMEVEEDVVALSGNVGNLWVNQNVDLKDYEGKVVALRFHGITGDEFASDLALDDINLTMTPVSAIAPIENGLKAFVYPNPTSGLLNLRLQDVKGQDLSVRIYDLVMKEVFRQEYRAGGTEFQTQMNLSNLPQGVYLMKIKTDEQALTVKFEVQ